MPKIEAWPTAEAVARHPEREAIRRAIAAALRLSPGARALVVAVISHPEARAIAEIRARSGAKRDSNVRTRNLTAFSLVTKELDAQVKEGRKRDVQAAATVVVTDLFKWLKGATEAELRNDAYRSLLELANAVRNGDIKAVNTVREAYYTVRRQLNKAS